MNGSPRSVLREVLAQSRRSFVYAGFFSLLINVLLLVPSMYMLAIYGRVLTSGRESTLWMLTLIALFLIAVMGALEWVRSQILIATGTRIDSALGARVFDAIFRQSLSNGSRGGGTQPLTDVQQLRQFLTGQGLLAFFDAPWSPIYVALLFAFHPWFGAVAAVSVVVLLLLALANELATRGDLHESNVQFIDTKQFTQGHLRNAEVIAGLGMLPPLQARWQRMQDTMLALQARASVRGGLIGALTRTYRIAVQSAILGVGAYLTIEREITAGHIFAGSLVLARALAPLDQLIGGWRGFTNARESYGRLQELLERNAGHPPPMALPPPTGRITVENLIVTPSGSMEPIIKGIGFGIAAGELIALIGPSGSGKSTLARTLLGLRPVLKGTVRYDGADVQQWDRAALGTHVGYLPQDVELLDGTVSDNIARFGEVDAGLVFHLDTTGMGSVVLSFDWRTYNVESGDVVRVGHRSGNPGFGSCTGAGESGCFTDLRTGPGAWSSWNALTLSDANPKGNNNSWLRETFALPGNTADLWVAFWLDNGEGDIGKIDNITVTGISITPVPVPAAAWLLISGLAWMLFGMRRRTTQEIRTVPLRLPPRSTLAPRPFAVKAAPTGVSFGGFAERGIEVAIGELLIGLQSSRTRSAPARHALRSCEGSTPQLYASGCA